MKNIFKLKIYIYVISKQRITLLNTILKVNFIHFLFIL